ncbi:MAG: 50S ribosomal protein L22 [Candidatus Liptonbacteria bacterium]|nr:50S ribosomal protein L22 [Candidatus Liptonbacteria bacterium]
MTITRAKLNYLRIAPRKVRQVADLIRGLPVNEAEAQLLFQRRRAAKPLLKLLRSAVANAKNNERLDIEKLYIESLLVNQGPILKRSLPRARGMATPLQKKSSHVTIVLSEKPELKSRFKIIYEKKIKLPPEEKGKAKKEQPIKEHRETRVSKEKKPGFFTKIFRRKSI